MAVLLPNTHELLLRSAEDLLAANEDLIGRIKLSFGQDWATFSDQTMPLIRAYAEYVHWLPATASDFFDRPGGLFRLGLETAFYAVQGTDSRIFSGRLTITARRHLEPRWRQATFIAGLGSELHRALGHLEVLSADNTPWPAYLLPLSRWLALRPDGGAYRLHWRTEAYEARSQGLLALPLIVPADWWQHLAQDNDVVVPHLLASVGALPLYRGHNVLDELVRRAFALVVERDRITHSKSGEASPHGGHPVRYLVEGLQTLVANNPAWCPNQGKSRLWYGTDGLFLVWPGAAHDLRTVLEAEQISGMPDGAEATLALLRQAELVEDPAPPGDLWTIRPPGAGAPLTAIKLASPALLLTGQAPIGTALAEPPTSRSSKPDPGPLNRATEQLPLIPPETQSPSQPPPPPSRPRWRIKAPLRLNASVRHALDSALCDPIAGIVHLPDQQCIFAPLQLFEAQRIAPALAIRALAEVGMLRESTPRASPMVQREDAGGNNVAGIYLKHGFVEPVPTEEASRASESVSP